MARTPRTRKPRHFSLAPAFVEGFQGRQPEWGYGGLGYFTYKRTYSRPTCDCEDPNTCGHPTEEWWQTCQRVVEGTYNIQKQHCSDHGLPWSEPKAQVSAQDMFQRMWDFKFLPPGRGLWMMGTKFVGLKGSAALNNCAFVSTEGIAKDFASPFCFLMDMSMLGVGVGGDARGAGKVQIRMPAFTARPFVVKDSREGWVDLIRTVLRSMVGKGALPTTIDFTRVRDRGVPIKTFGGTASGPKALRGLVDSLTHLLMDPLGRGFVWNDTGTEDHGGIMTLAFDPLDAALTPYRITSTQLVDIFNYIGKAVVAGGVRRSSEIMFGDADDPEFLALKQDMVALSDRRWASNNSIFGKVGMDYSQIARMIAKNGEPGIAWLDNMQRFSRMGDPPDGKDYRVMGANPCFAGDTLIAVADGRGAVPIQQLVEEGNDVPVYSINSDGKVEIKMARRPRMTREHAPLVEITLDDGTTFKVTPDHKMLLLDGTSCKAEELQAGDSLPRFQKRLEVAKKGGKEYLQVTVDTRNPRQAGSRVFEHRLIAQFHNPGEWDRLYDEARQSGWVKGGVVVHHKDYDPLNNSPDNLEILMFRDHTSLHGQVDNAGEKNPMWGKAHSAQTRQKIGHKTSERCSDPIFLAKLSASHLEAERQDASERMTEQRRQEWFAYYKEQEASTDLDTVWMSGRLHAVRTCETCKEEFIVPWRTRGQCYCTRACMNKAESHIRARVEGQKVAFADQQRQTLHDQVRVFKDLETSLGRPPQVKEWSAQCRQEGVAFRFRKAGTTTNPHALSGFGQLKQVAGDYNHRVRSVRPLDVGGPVFNLSVEDNHTLAVVTGAGPDLTGVFCANCVEQSLESFELCCLVETFPAHHDSLEDYKATLKKAYLYAKTVTLVPTHEPRSNAVMMRNRRIGTSMSGVIQAINKIGRRDFLSWCDQGYSYLRDLDRIYSDWLCVPLSIKLSSNKPSGTVSLLAGATPGIHYPHSQYYIRNVRVQGTSPLIELCRSAGYEVEPDTYAPDTFVVSFPVEEKHFQKCKDDVTIWEQFANTAAMQRYWADNQVSATITFRTSPAALVEDVAGNRAWRDLRDILPTDVQVLDDRENPIVRPAEIDQIAPCLENYETQLKAISLLPLSGHGYAQAPYITITQSEYEMRVARITALDLSGGGHEVTEVFCTNDTCEMKPRP